MSFADRTSGGKRPRDRSSAAREAGFNPVNPRRLSGSYDSGMTRAPVLAVVLCGVAFAGSPSSWTPELSMKVQEVSDVVPSPNGEWVVHAQTRAVMEEEKSEMLTHLFLARADGSRRFQLTQGDKSCTSPSFSPDSQFVYFLSERSAEEGKRNIWRIRMDGGEAERLTDWQGSLGVYKVSPNGKWVAFTGREKDEEKEQAKKEKRDFRVIDAKPENHGLWILPAEADQEGKREPKQVFEAGYHVQRFDWSPDSQRIAFELRPTTQVDDWTRADISEVEVATGTVRKLADTPAAEASPLYSPDGKYLVYQRTPEVARWASEGSIVLLPREGGEPKPLAPTKDQHFSSVYLLGWSRDSKSVIFSEPWGTRYVVYKAGTDGSLATVYQPEGTLGSPGVNSTGTQLGFMRESPDEPQEAYVMPLEGGAARQVSDAHGEMALPPVGKTEVDSLEVPRRPRGRGPAHLSRGLRGGPPLPAGAQHPRRPHGGLPRHLHRHAQPLPDRRLCRPRASPSCAPTRAARAATARSSGFANYDDWGGGDYQDIMAGVDHVIEMGVADPERMAVMGWSYGGYMTPGSRRTRTASAPPSAERRHQPLEFHRHGRYPRSFLPDYFSGEPWEQFEAFEKHSPMRYVKGQHAHADPARRGRRTRPDDSGLRALQRAAAAGRRDQDGRLPAPPARPDRAQVRPRHRQAARRLGRAAPSVRGGESRDRAAGGSPRAAPAGCRGRGAASFCAERFFGRRCGLGRLLPRLGQTARGSVPLQPAGFRLRLCFLRSGVVAWMGALFCLGSRG